MSQSHSKPVLTYTVEVRNPDGSLVSKQENESKSLLRNWGRIIQDLFYQTGGGVTQNVLNTAGAGVAWNLGDMEVNAAAADDAKGVLVGRGNTAVALNDSALVTPIAEGVGANQMNYALVTQPAMTEGAAEDIVHVQRIATNNSANSIDVKEIGLVVRNSVGGFCCLIIRDVITTATVAVGQSITVTFHVHNVL